jgi:hypothetical protein
VYNAMTVALGLGYSDTGSDNRRKLRNHEDEYLVDPQGFEGIAFLGKEVFTGH